MRIVPEFGDVRMPVDQRLYHSALNASSASMDDAHFVIAGELCRVQILFDNRRDVAWGKRMQVELRFDGDAVDLRIGHARRPPLS